MPYWRLSGFYFFYFATLGVLVPYWGLYLQSIGFTPVDIGNLIAILMFSRIVAPLVWAWIADHRDSRMSVVRVASFLTVIAFAGAFLGTTFWWLALVMLLFSFFWHASLPLLEVFVMRHTAALPGVYGRVRLWGSIGFIIAVTALGPVIDMRGPWWALPALLTMMLGIWLFSLTLPESEMKGTIGHAGPFRQALLRPEVFAFLLACLLMQISHGPYYTFYSIYLEGYGYSKTVIGALWAFAVLCEIGIFLLMQRLLQHIALRTVLMASFLLAAFRWLLIGHYPENLSVLILAQVLHAATFGSFHATAMQLVHRFFTGKHQYRGQAIYGSFSFGIGGAVGSFYSGQVWTALGPTMTFNIAAGSATMAFLVAYFLIRPKT
ncbi:MAG: MFS transporter [Gammaproteobacteria bacterium]|nr:MFS transporter [Gammaproteobacteria bacterium]